MLDNTGGRGKTSNVRQFRGKGERENNVRQYRGRRKTNNVRQYRGRRKDKQC